jgi:hypothetical protein
MWLLDMVLGRSCDMCGRRGSDVVHYRREGMSLHPKCKRQLRRADRG